ncbi:Integral inner nuclear membrane protein ima1 [Mycena sanguinolenta]|uniref:Integral inner nuclear membrane protein ima1 n=1 Tax=Mycena sanguinolenta TaxID=230812 RepID=A0A8H6XFJ6_9AGAR|nr:Integral inner nuclear membrane protein ima1 [Mycena sanguinolenta]
MLRRRSNISCYFCNSTISLPKDPTNFRCPSCGCLNRWVNGQIVSDEPAMHDESLNSRAFSTPPKDRIPTMYGPGVFCHTCQTNQMLLINLLANYLDNDESDQRMQTLDEYRESLYLRYPPVCDSCRPAVEEEIRRKDAMARTQALGGWLNQTKGKARQRQTSLTREETAKLGVQLLVWRIRGYLWATTVLVSIIGSASAALGYRPFIWLSFILPVLPIIATVSIFWAAWDPTYSSFRSARMQGRDVRVRGKTKHITLQMVSWALRLTTSMILAAYWLHKADILHLSQLPSTRSQIYFSISFVFEFGVALHVFLFSFCKYSSRRPSALLTPRNTTLISHAPKPPAPGPTTSTPEPENLLAGLSFSSKPVTVPKAAPVFGMPSMLSSLTSQVEYQPEADEMDVDLPTDPKGKAKDSGNSLWLRPQRFFAPEAPTGLEGLFERTKIIDDITMDDATPVPRSNPRLPRASLPYSWNWWWVVAPSLAFLVGVVSWVWSRRSAPSSAPPATTLQFGPLDTMYFGPL